MFSHLLYSSENKHCLTSVRITLFFLKASVRKRGTLFTVLEIALWKYFIKTRALCQIKIYLLYSIFAIVMNFSTEKNEQKHQSAGSRKWLKKFFNSSHKEKSEALKADMDERIYI